MMEQVNLCPVSVCNLLFDQSNSQQLCLLHYIISPIDLGLRWLCGAYRYLWWYPAMKLILSGLLLPGLTLGHLVIQSLCLLISGDVELNPGPLDTGMSWHALTQWNSTHIL